MSYRGFLEKSFRKRPKKRMVEQREFSQPAGSTSDHHTIAAAASGYLSVVSVKRRPKQEETKRMKSVTIAKEYLHLLQQIVSCMSEYKNTTLHSEAIPASESLRVRLCFSKSAVDGLMSAIMGELPSGEFIRIMLV